MPEDLGGGLYLALAGMGLVFLSLVVLLLVLLALQKLFPGEDVGEAIEADEDPVAAAITEMQAEEGSAIEERASAELQETLAAPSGSANGRIVGARIAVIAVALYLAMEHGEDVMHTAVASSVWTPSRNDSGWSVLGRALHRDSQGRRPRAYGQRSQSAYLPRNRFGE